MASTVKMISGGNIKIKSCVRMISIAVIGSGPSSFYLSKYLIDSSPSINIHMYEKFPTPYGLVRFGVACDHEKTKNVMNSFEEVARRNQFRYFGNVDIGADLSIEMLGDKYDAVVVGVGMQGNNKLHVPGEDVASYSARDFVNWFLKIVYVLIICSNLIATKHHFSVGIMEIRSTKNISMKLISGKYKTL